MLEFDNRKRRDVLRDKIPGGSAPPGTVQRKPVNNRTTDNGYPPLYDLVVEILERVVAIQKSLAVDPNSKTIIQRVEKIEEAIKNA